MQIDLERCPLCGSELSPRQFREIRAKLKEQDERKAAEFAEATSAIARATEEQFKEKLEQVRLAAERKAQARSDESIQKLLCEKEEIASKLKQAQAREVEIRKHAQAEIERERDAAAKKARSDADAELKKVTVERDRTAAKLREAEAREAAIRKETEQKAEKLWQRELMAQRQALEKDKNNALLRQQSEHNRERESLQRKLETAKHQLQRKTANELGDGGGNRRLRGPTRCFPRRQDYANTKGSARSGYPTRSSVQGRGLRANRHRLKD
jgi:hypothetical protein